MNFWEFANQHLLFVGIMGFLILCVLDNALTNLLKRRNKK